MFTNYLFVRVVELRDKKPPPLVLPILELLRGTRTVAPVLLPVFPEVVLPLLEPTYTKKILNILLKKIKFNNLLNRGTSPYGPCPPSHVPPREPQTIAALPLDSIFFDN